MQTVTLTNKKDQVVARVFLDEEGNPLPDSWVKDVREVTEVSK